MGFLSRLAQLIKSNLNDLINKSEDPEKMLNQVIVDMNQQLVEAKKQVAVAIADEKRLHKQNTTPSLLSTKSSGNVRKRSPTS
jgi:phage shock protein A